MASSVEELSRGLGLLLGATAQMCRKKQELFCVQRRGDCPAITVLDPVSTDINSALGSNIHSSSNWTAPNFQNASNHFQCPAVQISEYDGQYLWRSCHQPEPERSQVVQSFQTDLVCKRSDTVNATALRRCMPLEGPEAR